MSVAFAKEESAEAASETILPDREISSHPNLVTEKGLLLLQAELQKARAAYEVANSIEDISERRRQTAHPMRDLRYYTARLHSAQLVPTSQHPSNVGFGCVISISRDGGATQTYQIVGEDEANPKSGTISFVSPLARSVSGKSVGDIVILGNNEIEILAIS
ncbi:transcription elongation factor GreA [Ochrobactrum teleogrylli]|uniref:Transcription elongation factor GreA n=1 Tax=Ochrobactrum teleogrylli TaxID=2479765 RepID=A0ABY2Y120_9HYPH|nr:transcription elongation factor GreA [[Ochrobactrum] teleogrylli]TNV11501.1 transcription elongation factor GreA [[Ochrobactrum] teleogrylli]